MIIERTIGEGKECVYAYYFPSQRTEFSFPHKVGRTRNDPTQRIRNQQASMQEIPVIGTLVRCEDSQLLEAQLHTQFEHRRLPTFGREWFDLHPDALATALSDGMASLPWYAQLRLHRLRAGLSQTELAESAGLRQATVSKIESGGDVQVSTILEVCRELKLNFTFTPLE